jgi:hypothetical protein
MGLWPESPRLPMPQVISTGSRTAHGIVLAGISAPTPISTVIGAVASLLSPLVVTEPILLVKAFVMNGATVGGNFDIGIYDRNLNKIMSTGSVAQVGANVIQEVDMTDFWLGVGQYHLGFALDSATAAYFAWSTSFALVGGSNFQTSGTPFPLPATFVSSGTTTGVPLIGFSQRSLVA